MKCASGKEKKVDFSDMVNCEICGLKIPRDVAAIMCLKGKEYLFCSHNCQDRWEEEHPDELW